MEILDKFSNNLLNNMKDCPSEFYLSNDDFWLLLEKINNPDKPNAEMEKLFKKYKSKNSDVVLLGIKRGNKDV